MSDGRCRPPFAPAETRKIIETLSAEPQSHDLPGSGWTPSIVPNGTDQTVYLEADDFGKHGRAWREADLEATDLERVIQDLLSGEYKQPIRVIAFNTVERWSEDVSEDIAHELRHRCDLRF